MDSKIDFLDATIKVLHRKAVKNESDLKLKMKFLANICRRILHFYSETIDEFVPVALLIEKSDKIYILSKDKVKKEIKLPAFEEFLKLYPGLSPPKVIHISEINKIEKMLEKEEAESEHA